MNCIFFMPARTCPGKQNSAYPFSFLKRILKKPVQIFGVNLATYFSPLLKYQSGYKSCMKNQDKISITQIRRFKHRVPFYRNLEVPYSVNVVGYEIG